MGKILYMPDYAYMFKNILSDMHNDENSINQETFIKYAKHFNIIYLTKNDMISKRSYKYNKYNISSSTVKELDDDIIKSFSDNGYHAEMIDIVKQLPKELLTFSTIKIKNELPNIVVPYHSNNHDKILFVDNMNSIQKSINQLYETIYYNEINNLHKLTIRLIIPKFMINEICEITDNHEYSKCLFVNNEKSIGFYETMLNESLQKYNSERMQYITFMYSQTKDEKYLSDDVLYKVYLTRSIYEWIDIINELMNKYEIFKTLYKLLKNYPSIYKIMTYNDIEEEI